MTIPFFILAALALAGAAAAMTLRNLVHCAMALAICFIGIAGLYLDLGAQFLGLAQILVYVGAVVILIVFAILLTRSDELPPPRPSRAFYGIVIAAIVFGFMAWTIITGAPKPEALAVQQPHIDQIGRAMMQRFLLSLEIVAALLTAALIGAVIIAMEEKQSAR